MDADPLNRLFEGMSDANKEVVEGLKSLAKDLTSGKVKSDMATVDYFNKNYEGGYDGFQKTSAAIKAAQSLGNIEGLEYAIGNPEKLQSYLDKVKSHAINSGKWDDVKKDLMSAGLIDEKNNVIADNWIKGKSFLQANNMNSHNALAAGGMVFSGALGEDAVVQANAMDTLQTGSKEDYNKNVRNFNAGTKFNGQNRDDVHSMVESFARWAGASPEQAQHIADGLIEGWDRYGEAIGGASLIAAGAAYVKRKNGGQSSPAADPTRHASQTDGTNSAKNTTQLTTSPSASGDMDTPSNSLSSYGNAAGHNDIIADSVGGGNSWLDSKLYGMMDSVGSFFEGGFGKQAMRSLPVVGTAIGFSVDAALMSGVGLPQSTSVSPAAASVLQQAAGAKSAAARSVEYQQQSKIDI